MRGYFWRTARRRLEAFFNEMVPSLERPVEVEYRVELDYAEDGVERTIDKTNCEYVVMAPIGKGRIAEALLGSTTEHVVRISSAPVMVVPERVEDADVERLLAPIDFTSCSRQSLVRAVELAGDYSARLDVLHAYTIPVSGGPFEGTQLSTEIADRFEVRAREALDQTLDDLGERDLEIEGHLRIGRPHRVIRRAVEELESDLVVLGTHGRTGLERFFLGSTTRKLLRQPPCSLLTIRELASSESGDD